MEVFTQFIAKNFKIRWTKEQIKQRRNLNLQIASATKRRMVKNRFMMSMLMSNQLIFDRMLLLSKLLLTSVTSDQLFRMQQIYTLLSQYFISSSLTYAHHSDPI